MKISVAMTTYNGEKYVLEQLTSILNQSMTVDEVIICDDCSTDQTCTLIQSIKDSRIKLFHNQENCGYIENFYRAIKETSGDFIFLADQDDIWRQDKVQIMMDVIREENAKGLCTNSELIDSDGKMIEDRNNYQMDAIIKNSKERLTSITTLRLTFGNIAQGCTYCFTKEVKAVYLAVHNNEVIHDYQIALISSCLGKLLFLNEKLIMYRIHSGNAVGFSKNNRKIAVSKTISREPFMYRFLRQLNESVPVKHLFLYKILYYCRIPYIRHIFRRFVLGA